MTPVWPNTGGNGGVTPPPPPDVTFTVRVSASPANGGTVSGGGAYNADDLANISATPAPGWKFVNWTGSSVVTQSYFSFFVARDVAYVANFTPDFKISIDMPSKATLMEEFDITVNTLFNNIPILSTKIYYLRDSTFALDDYHKLSNGTMTFKRKAIKPGYWYARAVVETPNVSYWSAAKKICEEYPDVSSIIANSTVKSEMSRIWSATLAAGVGVDSIAYRQEMGTWIYLNTEIGAYEFDSPTLAGPVVYGDAGTHGSINPGPRPDDNLVNGDIFDPKTGWKFVVAFFHTHTPTYYFPYGRPVGISDGDETGASSRGIPAIAYDYEYDPNVNIEGMPSIPGEHPLNAVARAYTTQSITRREIKKQ